MINMDHRQGLSLLKKILEEISPKNITKIKGTVFIQKYLERSSLRIFLKYKYIPNLFEFSYKKNKTFCLEKEILTLLKYISSIDDKFFGYIINMITAKLKMLTNNKDIRVLIQKEEMFESLKLLSELDLIESSENHSYNLTVKGWEVTKIMDYDYYHSYCKQELSKLGTRINNLFWDCSTIISDYDLTIYNEILYTDL